MTCLRSISPYALDTTECWTNYNNKKSSSPPIPTSSQPTSSRTQSDCFISIPPSPGQAITTRNPQVPPFPQVANQRVHAPNQTVWNHRTKKQSRTFPPSHRVKPYGCFVSNEYKRIWWHVKLWFTSVLDICTHDIPPIHDHFSPRGCECDGTRWWRWQSRMSCCEGVGTTVSPMSRCQRNKTVLKISSNANVPWPAKKTNENVGYYQVSCQFQPLKWIWPLLSNGFQDYIQKWFEQWETEECSPSCSEWYTYYRERDAHTTVWESSRMEWTRHISHRELDLVPSGDVSIEIDQHGSSSSIWTACASRTLPQLMCTSNEWFPQRNFAVTKRSNFFMDISLEKEPSSIVKLKELARH